MFAWDGFHSDGSEVACFANGTLSGDADSHEGTYDITAGVLTIDNNDERITWNVAGNDKIDDDQGTIWFSIWIDSSGGADNRLFFESRIDASNEIRVYVTTTETLIGGHRGGGTNQSVTTNGAQTVDVWHRCAYSWQTGADAAGKNSICCDAECWGSAAEDVEDLDSWITPPDDVTIGENVANVTFDELIKVKDVYITSGYQDSDPAP